MVAASEQATDNEKVLKCSCGRVLGVTSERALTIGTVVLRKIVTLTCCCCGEQRVWRPYSR